MCSNYLPVPVDDLRRWNIDLPDFDYGVVYPGLVSPFLCNAAPHRWLPGMFGLMPHWAKEGLYRSTYNARSETVADKPAFRNAWRQRQFCVIPVSAFFEPSYESGRAVRCKIERVDRTPFGLAGIWERRRIEGGAMQLSYAMLTINADQHALMSRFHRPGTEKRSVVVLADEHWNAWLSASDRDIASRFLQPFDADEMRATPCPR